MTNLTGVCVCVSVRPCLHKMGNSTLGGVREKREEKGYFSKPSTAGEDCGIMCVCHQQRGEAGVGQGRY